MILEIFESIFEKLGFVSIRHIRVCLKRFFWYCLFFYAFMIFAMYPVVKEAEKAKDKDFIKSQELKKDFGWMNLETYKIIQKNCKKYNLDIILVCSVIQYESGTYCGNNLEKMKTVRSCAGAWGIMQVMSVHLPKNPKALENPEINIQKGCSYLKECIVKANNKKFKHIYAEACRMYNSGKNANRTKYKNWVYVNRIQNMYNRVSIELEDNKIYLAAL